MTDNTMHSTLQHNFWVIALSSTLHLWLVCTVTETWSLELVHKHQEVHWLHSAIGGWRFVLCVGGAEADSFGYLGDRKRRHSQPCCGTAS